MRPPAFWTIRHGRDAAPMLRLLLSPLGALYGASVARRLAKTVPLDVGVPVICIGNLTMGGTGKTPLSRLVRQTLSDLLDKPAAIVSRGYGGRLAGPVQVDVSVHAAADVGDEPLMLAADGPVFVGRDRAEAGRLAVASGMGGLVLDDGHQNPALKKALSIVVVDGQTGFGNGHLVPAGPLREPVAKGLARTDALIIMGEISEDTLEDVAGFQGPILHASLVAEPTTITRPVLGFCGIGRPEKFDATLRGLGLHVVDMIPFPDHHPFTPHEIAGLRVRANKSGAVLVTTEKDFARLPKDLRPDIEVIRVVAQLDEPDQLRALLRAALEKHTRGS